MAIQPNDLHVIQLCGVLVYPQRLIDRQPELIFTQAGRDIGMRFCIHIRVHSDGYGSDLTALTGDVVKHFQFCC